MSVERIACISDCHCGHISGVTPPAWWVSSKRGGVWRDIATIQRTGWKVMSRWIAELTPADGYRAVLLLGDMIDGRQEKQGGAELIVGDPKQQAEMAVDYIKTIRVKDGSYAMVYGTPYHTGKDHDYEDGIGDALGIPTMRRGDRITVNIDGCLIDMSHKMAGGQAPTGGDSALRTEQVQSHEWAMCHGFVTPHVIIRGHRHRHRHIADGKPQVVVLPGQQLSTRFGHRECRGVVDFGFACFDWDPETKEIVRWHVRKRWIASASQMPIAM